ncbi:MXAN_6652 family MXYO-CTERM-anchored protein [Corallococcus sp. EGB]|uniref:MXAN_6652 family MXYO-CTERM-anchored protein n=1 Tax=Corallococcus sp. EGB TaxID=1521117 RepID=UPI001CBE9B5F|nr:MXAN_6652 family MXYO-CTERM-anchored protein [Corallococcus sp. EGB]
MRSFLSSVGAVAVCLVAGSAFANSTGINGRSGKQGVSCTASGCHGGGSSTPTVTLEGPTALTAGQTGNYSLIITGGPGVKAGMNVAVDGATLTAGAGTKLMSGELTHSLPKAFSNGSARFDFSLVAPATNGTYKVYAAGNSVNGNNESTGDSHANATLDIVVTGGTDPVKPDPDDSKDGGGCSVATTGAPAALIAVFVALAARRRRQSGQA